MDDGAAVVTPASREGATAVASANENAKSTVEAAVAKTDEAVKAVTTTSEDTKKGLAAFKKDDGSIDLEKVLKEIVLPVVVVGSLVAIGLCVASSDEPCAPPPKESPVKSAISLFRSKKDDAEEVLEKGGRDAEKVIKKASKDSKDAVQESKNVIQNFLDWLGSLGKKIK